MDATQVDRARAKTGAFRLVVKPAATTDYRLATARDAAAFVRIRVHADRLICALP